MNMSTNLNINLENPIQQAAEIAKNIVSAEKNNLSEVGKKYIDDSMIESLIAVALKSGIDDSPLVVKQKIRNIIRSKIREEN